MVTDRQGPAALGASETLQGKACAFCTTMGTCMEPFLTACIREEGNGNFIECSIRKQKHGTQHPFFMFIAGEVRNVRAASVCYSPHCPFKSYFSGATEDVPGQGKLLYSWQWQTTPLHISFCKVIKSFPMTMCHRNTPQHKEQSFHINYPIKSRPHY